WQKIAVPREMSRNSLCRHAPHTGLFSLSGKMKHCISVFGNRIWTPCAYRAYQALESSEKSPGSAGSNSAPRIKKRMIPSSAKVSCKRSFRQRLTRAFRAETTADELELSTARFLF